MAYEASLDRYRKNMRNSIFKRIQTFLSEYPLVSFRILDGHPDQVVKYVEERHVELAIVSENIKKA